MADTVTKKHAIRAAIWGIILGLGVVIYLTLVFPIIALESVSSVTTQGIIVIVVVMIVSILWGMFGPAKKPKGTPPRVAAAPPADAAMPMDDGAGSDDMPMDDAAGSDDMPMGGPSEA